MLELDFVPWPQKGFPRHIEQDKCKRDIISRIHRLAQTTVRQIINIETLLFKNQRLSWLYINQFTSISCRISEYSLILNRNINCTYQIKKFCLTFFQKQKLNEWQHVNHTVIWLYEGHIGMRPMAFLNLENIVNSICKSFYITFYIAHYWSTYYIFFESLSILSAFQANCYSRIIATYFNKLLQLNFAFSFLFNYLLWRSIAADMSISKDSSMTTHKSSCYGNQAQNNWEFSHGHDWLEK
mgnify:CR=1 FL=1